jgi:hypothetical protein
LLDGNVLMPRHVKHFRVNIDHHDADEGVNARIQEAVLRRYDVTVAGIDVVSHRTYIISAMIRVNQVTTIMQCNTLSVILRS